jgi:beta-N-acetylhexosaminidase
MFRGWDPDAVVLTDDLQMQGVQKLMNTETACVRALEAGADVILLGHNMLDEQAKSVQFARKVANAVESDPRCRANFEASLKRIQKMKAAAQHEHRLPHSPARSPKSE